MFTTDGPTRMIRSGGTVSIIVVSVIFVGSLFAFSSQPLILLTGFDLSITNFIIIRISVFFKLAIIC